VIAGTIDVRRQTHALDDVVSKTPDVDHIAAAAQRWRTLNQGRPKPGCFQPEASVGPAIPAPDINTVSGFILKT
jgi:hypothetical protein